jgi:hypothetical protein
MRGYLLLEAFALLTGLAHAALRNETAVCLFLADSWLF